MKLDTKLLYKQAQEAGSNPVDLADRQALWFLQRFVDESERTNANVGREALTGAAQGLALGGLGGAGLGALYTWIRGKRDASGRKPWLRNSLLGAAIGGGVGAGVGGVGKGLDARDYNQDVDADYDRRYRDYVAGVQRRLAAELQADRPYRFEEPGIASRVAKRFGLPFGQLETWLYRLPEPSRDLPFFGVPEPDVVLPARRVDPYPGSREDGLR